jgi:hypothetical protein
MARSQCDTPLVLSMERPRRGTIPGVQTLRTGLRLFAEEPECSVSQNCGPGECSVLQNRGPGECSVKGARAVGGGLWDRGASICVKLGTPTCLSCCVVRLCLFFL